MFIYMYGKWENCHSNHFNGALQLTLCVCIVFNRFFRPSGKIYCRLSWSVFTSLIISYMCLCSVCVCVFVCGWWWRWKRNEEKKKTPIKLSSWHPIECSQTHVLQRFFDFYAERLGHRSTHTQNVILSKRLSVFINLLWFYVLLMETFSP